jgi:acylglycerol lipase
MDAPHPHTLAHTHTHTQPAPGQKVRATVLFTHGYGEHCARYHHVFAPFAAAGIRVLAYDQRGFGQTLKRSKRVGHNFGYATVLADAKFMSARVKLPGVPHFIMGHSMGGAVALKFAITFPDEVQGVISSGEEGCLGGSLCCCLCPAV